MSKIFIKVSIKILKNILQGIIVFLNFEFNCKYFHM